LHPNKNAEHEAEQVANTGFQVFGMTELGIESSLPALVVRVQPISLLQSSQWPTVHDTLFFNNLSPSSLGRL